MSVQLKTKPSRCELKAIHSLVCFLRDVANYLVISLIGAAKSLAFYIYIGLRMSTKGFPHSG